MTATYIVAIDPGNRESAYALLDPDLRPISFVKQANDLMYMHMIAAMTKTACEENMDPDDYTFEFAIEMIASYGMPVGKEVFETCVWIGQLSERLKKFPITYIYRKDEKMALCNSMKANDANITQALVDRFAPGEMNHGKGTKKNPGWFYGFKKDIWQAYAVGVTYHDLYLGEKQNE